MLKYIAGKKMKHPQGLCSLAPGYNMCMLRGCRVSDSCVMVLGDQMAFRRAVFAPSILTLQPVTVVLWEVNSICNIHSTVQPIPAEYVLLMDNYSHMNGVRIVDLREGGWTYWRIAAHVGHNVSVVCRCFEQCSVEHSYIRRPGSGRPRSTDARHDRSNGGRLNSNQEKI